MGGKSKGSKIPALVERSNGPVGSSNLNQHDETSDREKGQRPE
jgi:hypothetical protein